MKDLIERLNAAVNEKTGLGSTRMLERDDLVAVLELARDAQRWRALVNSPRLRIQGSAGFDPALWGGRPDPDSARRNPPGYRHFGMEFWNQHTVVDRELGARILTDYADATIDYASIGDGG